MNRLAPFALACTLYQLTAQTAWQQAALSALPTARSDHGLVYDSARDRLVMFGGRTGTTQHDDTWEWDGTGWLHHTPATRPSPRSGRMMAYDSVRRRVVLFGGNGFLDDTWEWDGSNWQLRTPVNKPPARNRGVMTYDSTRGRVVLFGGGIPLVGYGDDTWEWDGTDWTQRMPAVRPPPRYAHALAFDSARGLVVMFGGQRGGFAYTDTWEWDGTGWSQRTPSSAPSWRNETAMAYDAARKRVVLFGGFGGTQFGTNLADTWEWDGADWIERLPGLVPAARAWHAVAYDSLRQRTMMFGGTAVADMWEYAPVTPAAYVAFGAGCPGSHGTPRLAPRAGSLPWLGDTFHADVTAIGPSALVLLLLGDSRSSWGSLPLPWELATLGMPGCRLFTSIVVTLPLANGGGVATWTLPLPARAEYAGFELHTQCAVTSAGTNALGLVASNGGTLRVGSK